MKLIFAYNPELEYENFLWGMQSKNHSGENSALTNEILSAGILPENDSMVIEFVDKLVKARGINIQARVDASQKAWDNMEAEAYKIFERLFRGSVSFERVTGYLSANQRFAYNYKERFFFCSLIGEPAENVKITLHELLHFYTYYFIEPILKGRGVSRADFEDYKEALTVLLNVEFKDILGKVTDQGYAKQADLRKKIVDLWQDSKDVISLTNRLFPE